MQAILTSLGGVGWTEGVFGEGSISTRLLGCVSQISIATTKLLVLHLCRGGMFLIQDLVAFCCCYCWTQCYYMLLLLSIIDIHNIFIIYIYNYICIYE